MDLCASRGRETDEQRSGAGVAARGAVAQGQDSEAGSCFAERPLTMIASCRQQRRSVLDLLVAAGEAALQGTVAPSLLPRTPEG
jgi:hypothetical protein